jgi:hypothetical protein
VQLCCTHLLRDLQGVIHDVPDEEHAAWEARQTIEQAHTAADSMVDERERNRIEDEFLTAARRGISVNPHGGQKKSEACQVAERLADTAHQALRFTWGFALRLTWANNTSEQAYGTSKPR